VHPGVINTPIWGKVRPDLAVPGNNTPIHIEDIGGRQAPLGRVAKPQDIANGVLFLSMCAPGKAHRPAAETPNAWQARAVGR
jgi:NAD(P)-dependent dehydrogenase (short-subunit alcohol dehydrogenase family)